VSAFAYAQTVDLTPQQVDAPASVSCPTEDSCAVDYRAGAWHITKVVP
jgi:hypothetical protein